MSTIKYSLKLPLELDSNDKFIVLDDILKNTRQKLTTIVLTSPGEKIMDPNFGVGIKKILFEQSYGMVNVSQDEEGRKQYQLQNIEEQLLNNLTAQANIYCEDVSIQDVTVDIQEQYLNLEIKYLFKNYLRDNINITVGI